MGEIQYVDELMAELRTGLEALLARGAPLRREPAHTLATRMLAAVPTEGLPEEYPPGTARRAASRKDQV